MIQLLLLLLAFLPAPKQALKDDGFGMCPAFSHYHARMTIEQAMSNDIDKTIAGLSQPDRDHWGDWEMQLDGRCHADADDSVVDLDRKKLPVPAPYVPDKKLGWL